MAENVCASGLGLAADDGGATTLAVASTVQRPKPQNDRVAPFPQADKFPIVIGQGLTLSYLSSAFRLCNSGYRLQFVDVLNELMEKDPHAYSVVSKRVLTVGSGRLDVIAPDTTTPEDRDLAAEVAQYVKTELAGIPNLRQTQALLAWAVYYGVGAHEIIWGYRDDGDLHINGLEFVHHRRLSYSNPYSWDVYVYDQGSPAMPGGMPGQTQKTSTWGVYGIRIADYPGKFIVHEPRVRGDYPTREGVGREIAYWMTIKNVATRLGPAYLERYILPWIDIEFNTTDPNTARAAAAPRIATDEEIASASSAAQILGIGGLSNFVHSDAIKVNLRRPEGAPVLTVGEWVAMCDAQMSKGVLGATLTTEVSTNGGSRSLGGVQKTGEEKLYDFDATSLAATFDRDLVYWIVKNKYPTLPARLFPKAKIYVKAEPTADEMLARADVAARAGIPVDADAIAARCDLPVIPQLDPADLDVNGRPKPGPDGKVKPQPRRMIPIANNSFAVAPETIGLPKAPAATPVVPPLGTPGSPPVPPGQTPPADPNAPPTASPAKPAPNDAAPVDQDPSNKVVAIKAKLSADETPAPQVSQERVDVLAPEYDVPTIALKDGLSGGSIPTGSPKRTIDAKEIPISKSNTASAQIADAVYKMLAEDYPKKDLDWVMSATWNGPQAVPLNQIDWQRGDWKVDPDHIQDFVKKFKKNGYLKPAILVNEANDRLLFVADGHHRTATARKLGIPANAYVATVGSSSGGPWEVMHSKQLNAHQPHPEDIEEDRQLAATPAISPPGKFYLARHGEAGASIPNDPLSDDARPLSDEGRRHASDLADWMVANGEIPKAIYASPLPRTVETATIIAGRMGLTIQTTYGLRAASTAKGLISNTMRYDANALPLFVTHDHVIEGIADSMNADKGGKPAMAEIRILQADPQTMQLTETQRVRPSDINPTAVDHYQIPDRTVP